jgi:drug/metabolite transporter (DMT)-like permease
MASKIAWVGILSFNGLAFVAAAFCAFNAMSDSRGARYWRSLEVALFAFGLGGLMVTMLLLEWTGLGPSAVNDWIVLGIIALLAVLATWLAARSERKRTE